jgi:type IV pilus assembly protein PilZ
MSTPMRPGTGVQPGILNLNITDKSALYVAYMPYVRNGGLFIPTTKEYKLGDEVFMVLSLMDGNERLPVAGKVIWVTPRGAQNKRQQGIGIQFSSQDEGQTQKKIEVLLAGALGADRPTQTM